MNEQKNEIATVTISVDEYFELRTKAEANAFLMKELGELNERLYHLGGRVYEVENIVKEMKRP